MVLKRDYTSIGEKVQSNSENLEMSDGVDSNGKHSMIDMLDEFDVRLEKL
jgi:hypothetical protein